MKPPKPESTLRPGLRPLIEYLAGLLATAELGATSEAPTIPLKTGRARASGGTAPSWGQAEEVEFSSGMLTLGQILARALPKNRRVRVDQPSVYFLIVDDGVVYVGSTGNLAERLAAHKKRDYTHHAWIVAPLVYRELEVYYIERLRPTWNSLHRPRSRRSPP